MNDHSQPFQREGPLLPSFRQWIEGTGEECNVGLAVLQPPARVRIISDIHLHGDVGIALLERARERGRQRLERVGADDGEIPLLWQRRPWRAGSQ